MKIRMTADSTCDLSPELLRKYDIALAPLSVIIDGEVFHDGVDVTPRDVFRAADAGKSVRTAAVNAYEYKEFFGKQLRNCDQLVHICISSEFSTCYADACEAAAETGNVFVVDSRNLSTGSGLLALEGVEMAEKGMDGEAVAEALRGKTGLVDTSFVVRTIDYLRRGGRCSGLEALGAKMLHIRPSIVVRDGKMHPGDKYRGRYEHYLKHYIQDALAGRPDDRFPAGVHHPFTKRGGAGALRDRHGEELRPVPGSAGDHGGLHSLHPLRTGHAGHYLYEEAVNEEEPEGNRRGSSIGSAGYPRRNPADTDDPNHRRSAAGTEPDADAAAADA